MGPWPATPGVLWLWSTAGHVSTAHTLEWHYSSLWPSPVQGLVHPALDRAMHRDETGALPEGIRACRYSTTLPTSPRTRAATTADQVPLLTSQWGDVTLWRRSAGSTTALLPCG